MAAAVEVELVGAGGEPVDLWRTIASHGLVWLAPNSVDEDARRLETTFPLPGGPRTVRVAAGRSGYADVAILGPRATARERRLIAEAARRALRLDEDLSPFYARVAADGALAWAAAGAGRLLRSPTVFEDVVKTICTTNCAWSATVRMVTALVEHLGAPSRGGHGRAFPRPEAMAEADDAFYRDVVRAGYRGAYLRALAASVADGSLALEELARASPDEVPDAEVRTRLLALPGVGPYAAAHIMLLLGRYSELVLDSWTRPTYARLAGKRKASDKTIGRQFGRYREYAGLAFWLFLTRDWVDERPV